MTRPGIPASGDSGISDTQGLLLQGLLLRVYRRLYRCYGPQGWWPGDGPFDVVVGAILTQSAAWRNVELALARLKQAGLWSLDGIHHCPEAELADVIRPSGYYNAKARKLKAFAAHVHREHGGDLGPFLRQDMETLRRQLLSIYGVGPETADDILVYAAGHPSFVIDSYTRTIIDRMGLHPAYGRRNYESYQALFHAALPPDAQLFNEYHALLDEHAKRACGKRPICAGCCLRDLCRTGQQPDAEEVLRGPQDAR